MSMSADYFLVSFKIIPIISMMLLKLCNHQLVDILLEGLNL